MHIARQQNNTRQHCSETVCLAICGILRHHNPRQLCSYSIGWHVGELRSYWVELASWSVGWMPFSSSDIWSRTWSSRDHHVVTTSSSRDHWSSRVHRVVVTCIVTWSSRGRHMVVTSSDIIYGHSQAPLVTHIFDTTFSGFIRSCRLISDELRFSLQQIRKRGIERELRLVSCGLRRDPGSAEEVPVHGSHGCLDRILRRIGSTHSPTHFR